ncbi:APC amino acid permease [Rickenella mellea]|uniref:APC amino acid permease n=1 Tax=Rickenella mellea TaxID=50990 RepID=A0A4Y7QC78_9AGAM|nr:APC amino acid permease [Rickenella mellea]
MTSSIRVDSPSTPPALPTEESARSQHTDEAFLASLGYRQEFRREFGMLEVFGLAFSLIGVVPSLASVLVYTIPNGGTSAMVWGWAISSFFIMFVGLAIAELGSAAPTSGGLYYWTFIYSSPRTRNILSWIVAYMNTISFISAISSVEWSCSVQIIAAVSIASDLRFRPTTKELFGLYVALLVCHGIIASLATRALARLQNAFAVMTLLLCFAIIIALPIATPNEFKNSASYALKGFENLNGWPNSFAFILSFIAPVWTIGGFDSAVHISEESANARIAVPFAIITAVGMAGILGWAINVVLAFHMGTDTASILSSPIGQPLAAIFFNSFGKKGTLIIWLFIIVVECILVCSRQTFAFARDGGLPFSTWIYRINPYTKTPVNGVWFAVSIAFLLGLLAFAGTAAFGATFSLSIAGQTVAYSIPITARFAFRNDFKPGPFRLGRFSFPVAVIAVTWMLFTTVIFLFPSTPQTDANDMNYAVVVFSGTLALSVGYYYFPKIGGKYWFRGPVATIARVDAPRKLLAVEKVEELEAVK